MTRAAAMAAAALLGTGAAMAAAAGDDAHMSKSIPLTINGVSFKDGRKSVTINGVPFKRSSRGGTITINGVSLSKTGTLPRTLTINGNSFRSSGRTLTINGTTFEPGSATKPGPTGPQGPPGPAGTLAGPGPVQDAGPVAVRSGAGDVLLATGAFTASEPRRMLATGGFTAACNSCKGPVEGIWELRRGPETVARRRFGTLTGDETAGITLSELVVSSAAEYRLVAYAAPNAAGGVDQIDVTDIRLGLVDVGALSG